LATDENKVTTLDLVELACLDGYPFFQEEIN